MDAKRTIKITKTLKRANYTLLQNYKNYYDVVPILHLNPVEMKCVCSLDM